jgi:5-methyltetrahydrofolate--homocysteine methyltransferase
MTDHIRTLAQMSSTRISCYPNAGLPNEEDKYRRDAGVARDRSSDKFVEHGWLNIVGGCCGTTPAHIRAIAQMAEGRAPRRDSRAVPSRLLFGNRVGGSRGFSNRPLIVGERTNVIGSRLFKQMIAEEKWEEASEIARWQVKNGAHIIDVCLQSSDREELKDIDPFYGKLMPKIKAPVMIDTTDPAAMERALTWARANASSIRSISKTARRSLSACARSPKRTARR